MRNIIIVGGSKGIGLSIIKKLIKNNKIVNISKSPPNLEHFNLTHHSCDVLVDSLPEVESVDSIIYCPGSINLKPISRLKEEDFLSDFRVNLIGAVKTIQKYLNKIKDGDNPSIVLFSSVATKLGMPFHSSIAASKSAVEGFTKSLGAELAPKIRINAIAPTVTNTELASKLLRNDRMIEGIKERHPLKKFLEPDEVADMAIFLQSKKANSLSGQIIEMDCGIVSFKI